MSADDPVFVLVHGCTQGPTGWDRVRDILDRDGYRSVAIDLNPDRFAEAGALECAEYISEVTGEHEHVVMVGTSCSGILTPVVSMTRRIDHLVFVCSGLLDIGRSVTDQIANDGVLHQEWSNWSGSPDSPEAAGHFMFNDCPAEDLEWSVSTVRLFLPRKAYDEITPLTSWPSVPSTYLLGTHDRIISQAWARREAPARIGVSPIEIPTGHCPQNSDPALLAHLLEQIVVAESADRLK
jgi:pimeloyl-ACP methyl ester carboxylesterase